MYSTLSLPDDNHMAAKAFRGHMFLEYQSFDDAAEYHAQVRNEVPSSPFMVAQLAVSLYGASDFDASLELFNELEAMDPFRVTNIDTLSNLYFVREARLDLVFAFFFLIFFLAPNKKHSFVEPSYHISHIGPFGLTNLKPKRVV